MSPYCAIFKLSRGSGDLCSPSYSHEMVESGDILMMAACVGLFARVQSASRYGRARARAARCALS
eukprot:2930484-Pleurochrysis_carterae.AAC.1